MRRAVVVVVGAIALLLLAVPALATEADDHASETGDHTGAGTSNDAGHDAAVEHDEAADAAFGEGDWDGLLAAGAAAAVFGLVVFAFSNIGVKDEAADEAHH